MVRRTTAQCALELAEHLNTRVIAEVPVRQWVLTVPPPVRYLLAYNTGLLAEVATIFVHAVFAHLRVVARRTLKLSKTALIAPAAVCVPQRFNSALGLSPHLHTLVADGVWIRSEPGATPHFHALPEPSKVEITAVAWSCCERTVKRLRKQGLWLDAEPGDDRFAQEQPLLASLASASIAGLLATGRNAGTRPMRLFGRVARDAEGRGDKAPKNAYGFDLHAGTRAAGRDRKARERLSRYLLRPPLSNDRLTQTSGGKYRVALKRAWDDGTTALVLSGQELMARLVLLVTPPKVHTVRYFGGWARRSKLRPFIVPFVAATSAVETNASAKVGAGSHCRHRYRLSWAQALAKVFEIDVTVCPRCNEKSMRRIAVFHDPKVLRAIAEAIERKGKPP